MTEFTCMWNRLSTVKLKKCIKAIVVWVMKMIKRKLDYSGTCTVATTPREQPPLRNEKISTATSFPKYQMFPSQMTIFGNLS